MSTGDKQAVLSIHTRKCMRFGRKGNGDASAMNLHTAYMSTHGKNQEYISPLYYKIDGKELRIDKSK